MVCPLTQRRTEVSQLKLITIFKVTSLLSPTNQQGCCSLLHLTKSTRTLRCLQQWQLPALALRAGRETGGCAKDTWLARRQGTFLPPGLTLKDLPRHSQCPQAQSPGLGSPVLQCDTSVPCPGSGREGHLCRGREALVPGQVSVGTGRLCAH